MAYQVAAAIEFVIARAEPGNLNGVLFWDGDGWIRNPAGALIWRNLKLGQAAAEELNGELVPAKLARIAGVR